MGREVRKVPPDWRRVLLDAAALIEKHGHVKGFPGSPRVGFCMIGALAYVGDCANRGEAYIKMLAHLGVNNFKLGVWSDSHTAAEVIAALRTSAAA